MAGGLFTKARVGIVRMTHSWTINQGPSPSVFDLSFSAEKFRQQGRSFRILVIADAHIDSKDCDVAMLKRLCQRAVDENCPIIMLGDQFDAMQSRYDGRRMPSALKDKYYGRDDYCNAMVDDVASILDPYSGQIAMIGEGNHESAWLKHMGVDLGSMLIYRLKHERTDAPTLTGGYTGYIQVRFREPGTRRTYTKTIKWHHGFGGGVVSDGTHAAPRRAIYTPDADVVLTGHIHSEWQRTFVRERLTSRGRLYLDEQLHVQTPSLLRGWKPRGWAQQKGFAPLPTGATWLRFDVSYGTSKEDVSIFVDAERAR